MKNLPFQFATPQAGESMFEAADSTGDQFNFGFVESESASTSAFGMFGGTRIPQILAEAQVPAAEIRPDLPSVLGKKILATHQRTIAMHFLVERVYLILSLQYCYIMT